DAATAEISRSQIWQWINAGAEEIRASRPAGPHDSCLRSLTTAT
ncbi:hypothetical protein AB0F96_20640, partial [Streptomyces sp. NPDC023998]